MVFALCLLEVAGCGAAVEVELLEAVACGLVVSKLRKTSMDGHHTMHSMRAMLYPSIAAAKQSNTCPWYDLGI